MKRDLYIDFAKGLATLSVIFIHTTFWSGQLYIPREMRLLSLLFDVPVFFVLSGITSSGNLDKTMYRLLRLQITFMIFLTTLFFLDSGVKYFLQNFCSEEVLKSYYGTFGVKSYPLQYLPFDFENLGNWFVHQYNSAESFPVVMGSFWYMKVYFIVTVLGALILRFFPKHVDWFIYLNIFLIIYFNFFMSSYPTGQVGYVVYYLLLFLAGNRLKGKMISTKMVPVLYLGWAVLVAFVVSYFGQDIIYLINKQKFPPKLPYIAASLLSIITVMVLYNRLKITKDNFVNYIGKNAIFYYFGQGISSSLVYFIVSPLKDTLPWFPLMILVYIINVLLAIAIAELIKKIDGFGWKYLEFLRVKTQSRPANHSFRNEK